jgi:hypothetical protein
MAIFQCVEIVDFVLSMFFFERGLNVLAMIVAKQ